MVKKIDDKYICEECGLKYLSNDIAMKCEEFCKENNACNMEIIKLAVN